MNIVEVYTKIHNTEVNYKISKLDSKANLSSNDKEKTRYASKIEKLSRQLLLEV